METGSREIASEPPLTLNSVTSTGIVCRGIQKSSQNEPTENPERASDERSVVFRIWRGPANPFALAVVERSVLESAAENKSR